MPTWRDKPADRFGFNKRATREQQVALADAAQRATARLYADVLAFWRSCPVKKCRRHRRCDGEPIRCLNRGKVDVPPERHAWARQAVIEGGPRHLPPATRTEREMRQTPEHMWLR